ncbi:arginine kinase-like isoform X1 [Asterias amurensis]|uniref:arginine kinase-like isoform X1 n=2 Tax=Asterias amurensis TaxID=7602 RepID=UPI003AB5A2B3
MASLFQQKYDAEKDYPNFTGHKSLLSKHLTKDLYTKLRDVQTESGFTIDRAIQNGVDNADFHLGVLAGDEQTYEVYKELFDPIIQDYHNGFKPSDNHVKDLDPAKLEGGQLDEKYVISSRIRTGRNVRGYALSPFVCRAERRQVENIAEQALAKLGGELSGKYYSLQTLGEADKQQLIDDHFLFERPISRHFTSGGMARDFPDGRGIWHTNDKRFLVWVNEEDHLRIISMRQGGDMKAVFELFCEGLSKFEGQMGSLAEPREFMRNDHLGFILTCPSNLGTGVRCSVHARFPLLASDKRYDLDKICLALRLQKRGTSGEFTEAVGGVYDISNLDRLGTTEVQQVQCVITGINLLVQMEKCLEKGEPIDELLPMGITADENTNTNNSSRAKSGQKKTGVCVAL